MEEKNNYLQGIVGAIIGGLIATIPWILVYVYGKMLFSILAMLIALGAYKGYTLFKGKITKKTPIIIAIISFALVIISTLVIIPIWLMAKEGVVINIDNFKAVYSNSNFVSAIIRDLVISILFTFLGIGGVISNIKNISLGNVTEKTKEKNKKTIISIIVIAVLVSGIMIWNSLDKKENNDNGTTNSSSVKEKTFDIEGVRISLPNNMISYDSEQYNIYLANNDLLFLGIKETFTSLNSIGLNSDSTLEEYAEVIKQVNNTSSFIKKDNYMYYMKTENIENQNYDYVIVVKKSEDSFWLFNFAYLTSNKSVLQDKVFEYINTIEFY